MEEQLRRALLYHLAAGPHGALRALAREAGIEPASLSRFVQGKRTLTLSSAARLAAVLGLVLIDTAALVGSGEVTQQVRAEFGVAPRVRAGISPRGRT
jgi:hypothetical protein